MAIHPSTRVLSAAESRGIDDALARIVASAAFRCAPRLAAFLRFVVAMVVTGRGDRIKGYTIAVEALGRDASFDPQTDPIVRVEAGRLRRALTHFYAGEGADDPLIIELPLGRYVPFFRARASGAPTPATNTATLASLFEGLIELRQLQMETMAAEVEAARHMLDLSRRLIHGQDAESCRTSPPLLPTAPTSSDDIASPAAWPKIRKSPTSSRRACRAGLPTARLARSPQPGR